MTSWEERVPRVLETVGLDSIKNRIVLLALLGTLIPALATAVLSYRQNRAALAENLDAQLRGLGAHSAREVDLWVGERAYDVRVLTGSAQVQDGLERVRAGGAAATAARARLGDYLRAARERSADYAELLVTDAQARPVASSAAAPEGTTLLPPDWPSRLARGETVVGEPYRVGAGSVHATLAVPILNADGRFLGALAATLVFDAVDRLLAELATQDEARIDLVAADGALIASSAAGGAATVREVVQDATLERLAAVAEPGPPGVAEYVDRLGVPVVGTLAAVPALGWSIVAQIPSDVAYAQVAELRGSAVVLVSGLLLIVGALAYLLGVIIVRPLVRLTAGAGAVAAGDLSVDLPVGGGGEVGHLTRVFNDMVGQLRLSRAQLDERNRELERLSVTDMLTGLHNRRYLLQAFEREITRADRHESPFCVLMIDVDRFKQFNDTHGHLAGDQVLVRVGRVIDEATRDLDVAARYGGEEFVVLLPECDLGNGVVAAERIRSRLAEETFPGGRVTISAGVAEFPSHGETPAAVLGAADAALYEAKRLGRDRVQGAPPAPEAETQERTSRRTAAARRKRSSEG